MHNYKLGDKVYHRCDAAPFIVVGIRENEVEITGDWSGGTNNVNTPDWVHPDEIEMYDDYKVVAYFGGKPYISNNYFKRVKRALSICHDLLRDVDIYTEFHDLKRTVKECSGIATNGLNELYKEYPDLFLPKSNSIDADERSVARDDQSELPKPDNKNSKQ